jgi:predicted DNA-binding transcriptional regulator YafY
MKNQRILDIYLRLLNNDEVNKRKLAIEYCVSEKSIQRDISDLRTFFISTNNSAKIIYDTKLNSYILKNENIQKLTNSEILAVCKILLDSRAFLKKEMIGIIDKLISQCVPKENYLKILKLIDNEKFHYTELQHKRSYLENLWEIGESVQKHLKIEIKYEKIDKSLVKRVILPVGIMFSEYYFYVLAHIDGINKEKYFENKDDVFPTIYRIDRIRSFKVLKEYFPIPYKDRFEEGEFRKRVQFMTGGKLQKIKFKYTGNSLEAVLDKIPTAEVIAKGKDYYILVAEVFGNGINKWLLSQGTDVELI